MTQSNRGIVWLIVPPALAAMLWLLREAFVVLMPLMSAVFVAAAVWPVYAALRRRLSPKVKWLALPASMALVALAVVLFAGAITIAVSTTVKRAPQYSDQVKQLWTTVNDWAQARGVPAHEVLSAGNEQGKVPSWAQRFITSGIAGLWSVLGFVTLVFFFTALMLVEARRWAEKTQAAFKDDRAWKLIDTSRAVAQKVRQYLFTQTMVSLTSGVVEGTFLWLIGVELAFVWGLLFFILNYIPNVGSVIALMPPTLISLATLGVGRTLLMLGGIIVIETIIGYVVQPMWQGKNLSISPLIVLLSVVFWGWMWGAIGAVLAVPLTATFVIAAAHVQGLKPLALLLSETRSERELEKETTAQPKAS